ncbi:MAG: glycosyltransferase family 4 protein [Cetobacterium sp.]
MQKLLIYINSMSPAGGIERVVANLLNELSSDVKIILLTKDRKKSFYKLNENIEIQNLNNYLELDLHKSKISRIFSVLKNLLLGSIKLKNKIKTINPDFIYVVSPLEALEIILIKTKNQKLLISEHGSKFGYNKIYNFIKKIVYPKAHKLIVPSTMDTELYLKEGYPAVYIPHLNTFQNNKKNDLKNKIVLNIGRYTDDKQQDTLIEIWNELFKKQKTIGWKLHIVGKGENEEKLKQQIKKYGLQEEVKLLPPKKEVNEYFEEASIFAFTSRYEGFGMVLLEAMSFGIPCISFDCPSGPRDIIQNNYTGYLISNFSKELYIKKLYKLINNFEQRKKMQFKINHFLKKWNNEDILKKWFEILNKEFD